VSISVARRRLSQLALSPCGLRVAYCAGRGVAVRGVCPPAGSQQGWRAWCPPPPSSPPVAPRALRWLSSDHLLVVTSEGQLQVWEVSEDSFSLSHILPPPNPALLPHLPLHMAVCGNLLLVVTPVASPLYMWRQGKLRCSLPLSSGSGAAVTAVALRDRAVAAPSPQTATTAAETPKAKRRRLSAQLNGGSPHRRNGTAEGHCVPRALVCFSDSSVLELDPDDGTVTKFGALLRRATAKLQPETAIRGASWNRAQTVLSLTTNAEVLLFDEEQILSFDWGSVEGKKRVISRVDRGAFSKTTPDSFINKEKLKACHFVPKRKKVVNSTVDIESEAWKRIVTKLTTEKAFLYAAEFLDDSNLISVGINMDDFHKQLTDPFMKAKFGTN